MQLTFSLSLFLSLFLAIYSAPWTQNSFSRVRKPAPGRVWNRAFHASLQINLGGMTFNHKWKLKGVPFCDSNPLLSKTLETSTSNTLAPSLYKSPFHHRPGSMLGISTISRLPLADSICSCSYPPLNMRVYWPQITRRHWLPMVNLIIHVQTCFDGTKLAKHVFLFYGDFKTNAPNELQLLRLTS